MKTFKIFTFLVLATFWVNTASAKILPPGSLDPTFGVNGVANPQVGDHSSANAAVLQSDGKIVVGGSSLINGKKHFTLARYTPDGKLDPTFDGDGVVVLNASKEKIGRDAPYAEDEIQAMILQGDKIVVGGYLKVGDDKDLALARFNSNGTLDKDFEGEGVKFISMPGRDETINAMDVQSNGKIVVNAESSDVTIMIGRFNSSGDLDENFGNRLGFFIASAPIEVNTLKVQTAANKDKILFGGSFIAGESKSAVLFRLTAKGDQGDLERGVFNTRGAKNSEIKSITLQPDGKILFGATSDEDFALVRCNENCDDIAPLITVTDIDNKSDDILNAIAVQSDGNIVAVGSSMSIKDATEHFSLARYKSDGTLDTTFGGTGKFIASFKDQGAGAAKSVLIQPDGKILVIGTSEPPDESNDSFLIARFVDRPTEFQETPIPGPGGSGCAMVSFSSLNPMFLILWFIPLGYFWFSRKK